MNAGFNSFEDLFNLAKDAEDLTNLEAKVQQNTDDIDDNKTNISNNTNLISANQVLIANNISNITTNTNNISINSNLITTLNNNVLYKDGSILLDSNYTPTNNYGLVSKLYVDTHTQGNYLRIDGTNSMTANLNLANNNLININELVFNIATVSELNNVLDFKMGLNNVLRLQTNIISTFTNLDMNNNNIVNVNALQFPNALITEFSNILFFSTGGSTLFTIASLEINAFTNLNMNNNQITNTSNIISSGNISCVDINASGNISCVDINASGNISCVDINASGNVEILGDINLEANQIMDYGYNATGRATNTTEGKITYSTITPSYTLNIYGGLDATAQGQGVNRLTQIFGDVYNGETNTFHINSGSGSNGDLKFILEADDDNTDDNSTPQLLFRADGLTEGAMYLNDNTLDIVSAINVGGGIRFLTTTTSSDYTNANLALGITNDNQDVVVERNLGIQEAVDVDSRCYLQFARNNQNRDLSVKTGEINYQTNAQYYGHVLNIYGGRQSGSTEYRRIKMHDAVNIEGYLIVNSYATINLSSFRYYAYSSYGGLSSGNVNVSIHAPNGRIVAVEFNAVSDRRCKENITNITNETVDRYMKLEPKLFNWKKDESKKKYFGYIAQDVIYNSIDDEKKGYDDLAHLVNFVDDTNMVSGIDDITGVNNPSGKCMNINYDGCIPILHRALQIEREKNKILEERISRIETILNIA